MTRTVTLTARPSDTLCPECDGTGRVFVAYDFLGCDVDEVDCWFCHGTGYELNPIPRSALVEALGLDPKETP